MDTSGYFDLMISENDIESLTIKEQDHFDCGLVNNSTGESYKGFILARSPQGNKLTVCDTEFKRSGTDNKYQPRLIFRRVDDQFNDVDSPHGSRSRRIPFSNGEDGYREFWKMVAFLFKFKEMIDFGDFEKSYQVISTSQFKEYLNNVSNKEKIAKIIDELGPDMSEFFRTKSTLALLKKYKNKLQEFIDNNASETDVQNWLDEDGHKYRQQRCLIFGLEYIDFQREGSVSSKKFDLLTRIGSKDVDHVLIELKSPADDIFEVSQSYSTNSPTSAYQIHRHLARAIPQILEYKSMLEAKPAGDAELEKIGIKGKVNIGKCVIVIGKHRDDARWKQNRDNLVRSLGSTLEIWTYSELHNKLESTIDNLERIKEHEEIGPLF